MKRTTYGSFILMTLFMLVIPACNWVPTTKLESLYVPSVRIIDVNTEAVYNDAHIRGAMHVELSELEQKAADWDKGTPLVIYCSDYNCMASHSAAKTLRELGFTDVAVYAGGIHQWYSLSRKNKDKYPLEGKAEMAFLKKEVKKVVPIKEEANVVSAQEVAQRLDKMKQ